MARIATYIFVDLETTGIPKIDLNKTRITELSMVPVKRRHILDTKRGELPRVQHKLTMCFNPGRMIEPGATNASGLDNFLLEYETTFNNNVFNTINSFIKCQEKPVCLIAENGHKFDFPILKNHFEKLNVCLDDDVMCADSLEGFFDILNSSETSPVRSDSVSCEVSATIPREELLQDLKCIEEKPITEKTTISALREEEDLSENKVEDCQLSMKEKNERTPIKPKVTPVKRLKPRKIFFEGSPKPKLSYKLKDIYERVLKRPGIEAHRAENDCIMTAEIATVLTEKFVTWIDENNFPFSEIKAMRLGVPLGQ